MFNIYISGVEQLEEESSNLGKSLCSSMPQFPQPDRLKES